jgi:ankyrin repeat protein
MRPHTGASRPFVRFLLEHHADPQIVDKRGRGPLTKAIVMGKEDYALPLLQAQPPDALSPQFPQDNMQAAISKGEASVVDLLFQKACL